MASGLCANPKLIPDTWALSFLMALESAADSLPSHMTFAAQLDPNAPIHPPADPLMLVLQPCHMNITSPAPWSSLQLLCLSCRAIVKVETLQTILQDGEREADKVQYLVFARRALASDSISFSSSSMSMGSGRAGLASGLGSISPGRSRLGSSAGS